MCLLPMWSAYVDWALRSVYHQSCFQPPPRSHSGSPPISNRWCSCGGQVAHRGWIGKVCQELLFSWIGSTTFRIECQVWMQSVWKQTFSQATDGRGSRKCLVDSSYLEHDSDKEVRNRINNVFNNNMICFAAPKMFKRLFQVTIRSYWEALWDSKTEWREWWDMTIFKFLRYTSRSFQFSKHCFHFSDALASLALIIVFHSLTRWLKLEIGNFACLTVLAPPLLYSIGWEYLSGHPGQSGHFAFF